ncbi:SH2 domain-containing protein 1B [Sorex fumeus]|uniref:SH2 domain-containing protein 1B n=1 Tax=Sorex fumeus TaxID=62283 RepID=UPI0024AD8AAB|nr:SH2 domain-containing protein 1B [Sorex fumeus]
MDLPCYHGPLSKVSCERLLLSDGVDGNYLLRDSETVPGVVCLCVSFRNTVYTYRIFKEKPGHYNIETVQGRRRQVFPSLQELINTFQKPDQGLVVALLQPIPRGGPCLGWRRSKLELEDVYENSSSEYMQVLP